jgi:hypothetical protein
MGIERAFIATVFRIFGIIAEHEVAVAARHGGAAAAVAVGII